MVSHVTDDVRSAMGVNDRAGLMEVEAQAQRQILAAHAEAGVTFLAPDSICVEAGVTIGADTVDRLRHHAARRAPRSARAAWSGRPPPSPTRRWPTA